MSKDKCAYMKVLSFPWHFICEKSIKAFQRRKEKWDYMKIFGKFT